MSRSIQQATCAPNLKNLMQLKLDMSCHLLNVYTKFQIDISKHVEEKSGKRGRTDRRTDIATA